MNWSISSYKINVGSLAVNKNTLASYVKLLSTLCSCVMLESCLSEWTNAPDNELVLIARINRTVTSTTVSCKKNIVQYHNNNSQYRRNTCSYPSIPVLQKEWSNLKLTWTKRPCKGDTLLSFWYSTRHIGNIIGTGPSSCSVYRVWTRPWSSTTLQTNIEQYKIPYHSLCTNSIP